MAEPSDEKPSINLVVMGQVGGGKSTLAGHLLYKLGEVEESVLEQCEEDGSEMDKGSVKYAWVLDKLKPERERGLTIDLHHQSFQTEGLDVTLIDSPGHQRFMKKMILGASQADCALLVVSAVRGEFEVGVSKVGETRDHLQIGYTMNVKQVVVAVNKMDKAKYKESRFDAIKKDISALLKSLGYDPKTVPFVPISAWHGDNLTDVSESMPWYEGWEVTVKGVEKSGKTLHEAIDAFRPPKRPNSKPLRVAIEKVFQIKDVGTVPVGRVEYGKLRAGEEVLISPGDYTATVASIERHHQDLEKAISGHVVGFHLEGLPQGALKRGCVCSDPRREPVAEAKGFVAQILITDHPTVIRRGYCPIVFCHTARVACRLVDIIEKTDRYGRKKVTDPESIKKGDIAIVKMKALQPLVVESYSENSALARIILRDSNKTIATGWIKSVKRKEKTTDEEEEEREGNLGETGENPEEKEENEERAEEDPEENEEHPKESEENEEESGENEGKPDDNEENPDAVGDPDESEDDREETKENREGSEEET